MIKTILFLLFISTSLFANDFKIIIRDKLTGDVQIENNLNFNELTKILNELKALNDSFLKTEIYENLNNKSTVSFKSGGAEGG